MRLQIENLFNKRRSRASKNDSEQMVNTCC